MAHRSNRRLALVAVAPLLAAVSPGCSPPPLAPRLAGSKYVQVGGPKVYDFLSDNTFVGRNAAGLEIQGRWETPDRDRLRIQTTGLLQLNLGEAAAGTVFRTWFEDGQLHLQHEETTETYVRADH